MDKLKFTGELNCSDCYIKIERDGHKFRKIIIDLSEIEKMSQQLTTLQAEKERLEGELGRLRKSLDQIGGLWTCPDCGAIAKNGRVCPGCGLNHPEQSTKHPTQEPTNGS